VKRAKKYFYVAVAGFLLAQCFPPTSYAWPVALISLVVFFHQLQKTLNRGRLSFVFAAAYFLTLLQWMSVIGLDAWIGLAALCSLWWAASGWLLNRIPIDGWWALKAATIFTAFELLRDRVPFGGFGWGQIGVLTIDFPLVRTFVPILGQTGMTFLLFLTCASIATRERLRKRQFQFLALASLSLAMAIPLTQDSVKMDSNKSLSIGLVQGGVVHTGLGTSGPLRSVLKNHIDTTLKNLTELQTVDLIIWPESSSDLDPIADYTSRDMIDKAVAELKKPILLGANRELANGKLANTSLLWKADSVQQIYQKRRLVPFGEFLPFRNLVAAYTDRAALMPRDFESGSQPGQVSINGINLDVLICFEIADDSLAFDTADDSAAIVVHTNNATYQHLGQSEQQFLYARFRALETSRPVLSVSTSGLSGVVDATGSTQSQLTQNETGVLTTAVYSENGKTVAMRVHNVEVGAIFVGAFFVVLMPLLRRRKVAP
jgi:apolipoprotein N-acyltransferase